MPPKAEKKTTTKAFAPQDALCKDLLALIKRARELSALEADTDGDDAGEVADQLADTQYAIVKAAHSLSEREALRSNNNRRNPDWDT
jgi:hypothetical protein